MRVALTVSKYNCLVTRVNSNLLYLSEKLVGTVIGLVRTGLLLNRLSQLSMAVIADLATALLLFGVVALFLWEQSNEMEFDAESVSNFVIGNHHG